MLIFIAIKMKGLSESEILKIIEELPNDMGDLTDIESDENDGDITLVTLPSTTFDHVFQREVQGKY